MEVGDLFLMGTNSIHSMCKWYGMTCKIVTTCEAHVVAYADKQLGTRNLTSVC